MTSAPSTSRAPSVGPATGVADPGPSAVKPVVLIKDEYAMMDHERTEMPEHTAQPDHLEPVGPLGLTAFHSDSCLQQG